jgi:hypothetical protein
MSQPPIISVALNGDVILSELKDLLRDVQVSISRLATTAELSINETFGTINRQVLGVSDDIKTISSNVSTSSAGLPDPWVIIMFMIVIISVLCLLVIFLLLRTRRELKQHPIRRRKKLNRNRIIYETANSHLFIPEEVIVSNANATPTRLKVTTDV